MSLEVFIRFNGKAREALAFYGKAFGSEPRDVMTFGQMPSAEAGGCSGPMPPEAKDLIGYAGLPVGDTVLMLSDVPPNMPVTVGDNIAVTYSGADKEELHRLFKALSEGGKVEMELQKTFFSELFGVLTDKFGVVWQLIHYVEKK